MARWRAMLRLRASRFTSFSGRNLFSTAEILSNAGTAKMYDGDRCNMVTCSAVPAIEGTRVTAVAPLPITTTFLPA